MPSKAKWQERFDKSFDVKNFDFSESSEDIKSFIRSVVREALERIEEGDVCAPNPEDMNDVVGCDGYNQANKVWRAKRDSVKKEYL